MNIEAAIFDSAPHIKRIGNLMHQLVDELAPSYGDNPSYQMLRRVFEEHFVVEEEILWARSPPRAACKPRMIGKPAIIRSVAKITSGSRQPDGNLRPRERFSVGREGADGAEQHR